ncbi:MAG: Ras-related protein Rab-4B [Marteilia pararefringens]
MQANPSAMRAAAIAKTTFKIFVVGNSGAGKTSFIHHFVNGVKVQANSDHYTTLGVDFYSKTMNVNGIDVEVQVWDTAGQERFRSISGSFMANCDGILSMESFDPNNNSTQDLYRLKNVLVDYQSRDICVAYALGKSDLYPNEELKQEKMNFLRKELGLDDSDVLTPCSALTGENIDMIMQDLVRRCLTKKLEKSKDQQEQSNFIKLELDNTDKPSTYFCCLM